MQKKDWKPSKQAFPLAVTIHGSIDKTWTQSKLDKIRRNRSTVLEWSAIPGGRHQLLTRNVSRKLYDRYISRDCYLGIETLHYQWLFWLQLILWQCFTWASLRQNRRLFKWQQFDHTFLRKQTVVVDRFVSEPSWNKILRSFLRYMYFLLSVNGEGVKAKLPFIHLCDKMAWLNERWIGIISFSMVNRRYNLPPDFTKSIGMLLLICCLLPF